MTLLGGKRDSCYLKGRLYSVLAFALHEKTIDISIRIRVSTEYQLGIYTSSSSRGCEIVEKANKTNKATRIDRERSKGVSVRRAEDLCKLSTEKKSTGTEKGKSVEKSVTAL